MFGDDYPDPHRCDSCGVTVPSWQGICWNCEHDGPSVHPTDLREIKAAFSRRWAAEERAASGPYFDARLEREWANRG